MATAVRLSEALDQYLSNRRQQCAPTTVINDGHVLRRFVKMTGDIQLRNVREHHVEAFFFGPRGAALTLSEPSSINNYRKRLAAFFSYCAKRGWLRTDPMAVIRTQKIVRRPRLRLTADELLRLLDLAGTPRNRTFVAVAINTALRASEIVSLRVGDVDLGRGLLTVTISKTAEVDEMPITKELDLELRRWLCAYQQDLGSALEPDMRLVPATRGPRYRYVVQSNGTRLRTSEAGHLKPYSPVSHPAGIVHDALVRMGKPTKGEGIHTIRRSVGRLYFDMLSAEGYDAALRATSALLHHSSTAVTEIYLGLDVERRKRDEALKGQSFLAGLVPDNVVPMKPNNAGLPTTDQAIASG